MQTSLSYTTIQGISLGSFVNPCAKSVTSKIMTESQKTNNKRHFRGVCHFFPPIWSSFLPILPPGEMKIKCLDILIICISFKRVFDADQQSYNNHTLKINIFPGISIRSKTNDVIDYVMSRVKLSIYVFHAYHSKGNLTLISNHMSIIHSISIFFQIIRFEVDKIVDSFMKSFLTPLHMLDV